MNFTITDWCVYSALYGEYQLPKDGEGIVFGEFHSHLDIFNGREEHTGKIQKFYFDTVEDCSVVVTNAGNIYKLKDMRRSYKNWVLAHVQSDS